MTEKEQQDKDNKDWLDLLAGRKVDGVNDATRREAETLRETLLNIQTEVDDIRIKRAEKALFQRLQKEELIKSKKPFFNPKLLSALAASVSVVAVALSVFINTQTIPNMSDDFAELPIYRTNNDMQQVLSSNPDEVATEFRESLHNMSVPYKLTEADGGWEIVFYTVGIQNKKLFELMEKYHLAVDGHGWMRLKVINN